MQKFFKYKWAVDGETTAVPNAIDPSGFVSYRQGYGADYSRVYGTDPLAKAPERVKLNAVLQDITAELQSLQVHGFSDYITPALNDGTAYAYDVNAVVRFTDGKHYQNIVAGNTDAPDVGGWTLVERFAPLDSPTFINRIKGDFSNATAALRTLFQTATVNAGTALGVIPNGSGASAGINLWNSIDPLNSSSITLQTTATGNLLASAAAGTGTLLPLGISMGGAEEVRLETNGNFVTKNNNGIGHGVGSGGTVTQSTSKGTSVTLNKQSGKITMNNSALAANTRVFFLLTNSEITTEDTVTVSILGASIGGSTYNTWVSYHTNGNCIIGLWNFSGGSLSEAVQIQFNVHKGATA